MIEVENLSKTFKVHKKEAGLWGSVKSLFFREWIEKEAVRDISFTIGKNEIVGLIGSNGAGKTTLVKMLSGIIHPSHGRVKILDYNPWKRDNEFRRQISLIMGQKASLWWDLPAADCFLLLREIYQIPLPLYHQTLNELAEKLEVKNLLNIQIRRLSLGERMKMELIAALLHRPKVIFLDEPTIGLDLMAQKTMRDFLLQYQKDYNPSMILTSHYMEDIEKLCKRILIIKDGSLIYDGPLQAIIEKFARHKIISALLEINQELPDSPPFPRELGEVISHKHGPLKIKVFKDKVPQAASYLLNQFPIRDLNIEEMEIGEIISSLMREGLKKDG